eukprot:scaffold210054_cov22-Tisochrysis_lutea.AAC.1
MPSNTRLPSIIRMLIRCTFGCAPFAAHNPPLTRFAADLLLTIRMQVGCTFGCSWSTSHKLGCQSYDPPFTIRLWLYLLSIIYNPPFTIRLWLHFSRSMRRKALAATK